MASHKPAMPCGEPLGLSGYCVVGSPAWSTYRTHAWPDFKMSGTRDSSGNLTLPSPCATQMPMREPCMPWSMTAGVFSSMPTVVHLDSKRPESLWMKRGCSTSTVAPSPPSAGTNPRSAMSWHPLQMPSENVSALL